MLMTKLLDRPADDGYRGKPAELRKTAGFLLDIDFDTRQRFLVSWKRTPQAPCYQGYIQQALLSCGYITCISAAIIYQNR
jgi:hypothetical protein